MAGFSGFKVGEVEYGQRDDEFILRLMSDCASNAWRRCYALADAVTRLDLQVTVEMKSECAALVWKYYHKANKLSAAQKRGPRNRVILGNDGGATLYCGERTSNRFGRVYAKGPQTKMDYYKTCLRFEIQYNGRLAKLVARKLAADRDERQFAIDRNASFFEARIGSVPVRSAHFHNDVCPRRSSDVDKKLLWLRKAVRNSVIVLLDHGMRDEVLDALGLVESLEPSDRKRGPSGP